MAAPRRAEGIATFVPGAAARRPRRPARVARRPRASFPPKTWRPCDPRPAPRVRQAAWTAPTASPTTATRFVGADTDLVYFDGNSLGRPPVAAIERLSSVRARASGAAGSSAGGTSRGCSCPSRSATASGARRSATAGQTVIGDSTTVLLYKLDPRRVRRAARRDPRARRDRRRQRQLPHRPLPASRASPRERGRTRALDRRRPAGGRDRRALPRPSAPRPRSSC